MQHAAEDHSRLCLYDLYLQVQSPLTTTLSLRIRILTVSLRYLSHGMLLISNDSLVHLEILPMHGGMATVIICCDQVSLQWTLATVALYQTYTRVTSVEQASYLCCSQLQLYTCSLSVGLEHQTRSAVTVSYCSDVRLKHKKDKKQEHLNRTSVGIIR